MSFFALWQLSPTRKCCVALQVTQTVHTSFLRRVRIIGTVMLPQDATSLTDWFCLFSSSRELKKAQQAKAVAEEKVLSTDRVLTRSTLQGGGRASRLVGKKMNRSLSLTIYWSTLSSTNTQPCRNGARQQTLPDKTVSAFTHKNTFFWFCFSFIKLHLYFWNSR